MQLSNILIITVASLSVIAVVVLSILLWNHKLKVKIKNNKLGEIIISNPSEDSVFIDQDNKSHVATHTQTSTVTQLVSTDIPIDLSKHPIFNEFDVYIEYGLNEQFDLNRWNQFLGYHVCKIMFLTYKEYLSKLASGEIHENACTSEYLSMVRSLPERWRSASLVFKGYRVYGIPQLMINKFHELRLGNIRYIGSYISDITTRYSKRITRLSCIFEVIASSLFYYSTNYIDVLSTMNGDLDRLNPANANTPEVAPMYSEGEYHGETSE